jgi:hypothetical protein
MCTSTAKRLSLLSVLLCLLSGWVWSDAMDDQPLHFLPADVNQVHWIFSGVVANEQGEQYGYFFQMERDGNAFHSTAAVFDSQTKAVIFQDESRAVLDNPSTLRWQVGHAMLRFNPINDSWIFGVKTADKQGFNFKIDMLKQPDNHWIEEGLRPGMAVVVSQTNALNGHIRVENGHDDQFVTAPHAWFRQMWTTIQEAPHPVSGVLCHFDDGSGFYSVRVPEPDATQGALAGWFDPNGLPLAMSQFIRIKQLPEGPWDIRVSSPNVHVVLSDYMTKNSVVAGFVTGADSPGFCLLSDDSLGKA